jgi:hypothetical protein
MVPAVVTAIPSAPAAFVVDDAACYTRTNSS